MKQTQVKVVLLGDSGVGKSSLLFRYVTGTFEAERGATLGASFMSKVVSFPNLQLKFNIWDTAGQERYKALAKMYYRDACVAILVYALDQPDSLLSLQGWEEELRQHGPSNVLIAVAANKEDTTKAADSAGVSWAQSRGVIYRRTSAKLNTGIDTLFEEIAMKLEQEALQTLPKGPVRVEAKPRGRQAGCCAGNKTK